MVTEIEQIVKKLGRQEDEIANEEGFVFRFHPDNYRVKLKFNDYVRLHRLLTGFSNLDIWRSLSEGNGVIEFLDRVPDEFDKWVRSQVSHLQEQYDETQRTCRYLMKENFAISKKDFAEKIKNLDSNLKPIVFAMYDQKEYSKMIWKNLRPVYQKPFWQKDED
jgi:RNA ligase